MYMFCYDLVASSIRGVQFSLVYTTSNLSPMRCDFGCYVTAPSTLKWTRERQVVDLL